MYLIWSSRSAFQHTHTWRLHWKVSFKYIIYVRYIIRFLFLRKQQHLINYIRLAGNENNRTGSDIQINLDFRRVEIGEQINKFKIQNNCCVILSGHINFIPETRRLLNRSHLRKIQKQTPILHGVLLTPLWSKHTKLFQI